MKGNSGGIAAQVVELTLEVEWPPHGPKSTPPQHSSSIHYLNIAKMPPSPQTVSVPILLLPLS